MNNSKRFASLFLAGLVASGITVSANAEGPKKTGVKLDSEISETVDDSIISYTIKKGDTLYNLCVIYYGDGSLWQQLAQYNGITNVRTIPVGKVIKIPKDAKVLKSATETKVEPVITPTTGTYTIKSGDTLYGICEKYYGNGNLWKLLASYNGIKNEKTLQIGQVIFLPETLGKTEKPIVEEPEELGTTYTIKQGDTLTDICQKYYNDSTVQTAWKLATYNGLENPNKIYVGKKLTMPDYDTLLNVDSFDYNVIILELKH